VGAQLLRAKSVLKFGLNCSASTVNSDLGTPGSNAALNGEGGCAINTRIAARQERAYCGWWRWAVTIRLPGGLDGTPGTFSPPHMKEGGRVTFGKNLPRPSLHSELASCSIAPFAASTCAMPAKKACIRSAFQPANSAISTLTLTLNRTTPRAG
jgi:hypothetical protein